MKIFLTAHIKQHAGDILLECQDSFDYNLEKKTFSVSDGVSQAYRPELWSRLLTSSFVNNPDTWCIVFHSAHSATCFAVHTMHIIH